MFKILVPLDFSKLSEQALNYAVELNKTIQGELILFNAIYLPNVSEAMHLKIEENIVEDTTNRLAEYAKKINQDYPNWKITYDHAFGFPVDAVADYAKLKDIDLVVIGTKGATGLTKVLLGSIASGVIEKVPCAVITVPPKIKHAKIEHLAFAAEIDGKEIARLKNVVAFAKLFNAQLHVVHVFPEAIGEATFDTQKIEADFQSKLHYPNITFYAEMAKSVIPAIENFVNKKGIDMLALYTHKRNWLEKLFNSSMTQELAHHNSLPLLVFKTNE